MRRYLIPVCSRMMKTDRVAATESQMWTRQILICKVTRWLLSDSREQKRLIWWGNFSSQSHLSYSNCSTFTCLQTEVKASHRSNEVIKDADCRVLSLPPVGSFGTFCSAASQSFFLLPADNSEGQNSQYNWGKFHSVGCLPTCFRKLWPSDWDAPSFRLS